MDTNALQDQLKKLHEELGNVNRVDAHSSHLLGEIMQDIQRLMAQHSTDASSTVPLFAGIPARTRPSSEDVSLPDRLEQVAVQFEADHPTLAASSRRLVDLLGKAGL